MTNVEWDGTNRRELPRQAEWVYRLVVALSIIGWIGLVIALLLFDMARPEFVIGLYKDPDAAAPVWSVEYLNYLIYALRACLGCTLVAMLLNVRRNRRKNDNMGINLFILLAITIISLITLWFVRN